MWTAELGQHFLHEFYPTGELPVHQPCLYVHIICMYVSWLKVTSKEPTYVHFPCASSEQVKSMYVHFDKAPLILIHFLTKLVLVNYVVL